VGENINHFCKPKTDKIEHSLGFQMCVQHPVPSPYLYQLPSFFSLGQTQKLEWVLPASNASVFAPWHARSRAWPPKYTKTIRIWHASCTRQEVTKQSGVSLKSSSTFAKTLACQWNIMVKQGMGGHESNLQHIE
jgi:hypothetical protein